MTYFDEGLSLLANRALIRALFEVLRAIYMVARLISFYLDLGNEYLRVIFFEDGTQNR